MDATLTHAPATIRPAPLLRLALLVGSAASGGLGLLMLLGGGVLAGPLGLPAGLLQGAGATCLGWAAITGWLARRETLPPWAVWAVIGLNLCWVADSVILLLSGWVAPTASGITFVLAQALAVDAFAVAQWIGLRRSR
jgi:hypothetical protein